MGRRAWRQYIVGGAQYLVAKNNDSGSIFYHKLDTSKIGAFGHSQGAGGVLNAVLAQPTLFKSAIPNALPNPMWWTTPVPSLTGWPTTVPIWIQCGSSDGLICSALGDADLVQPGTRRGREGESEERRPQRAPEH